ncbi:MAG: ABC transporter permease, partial [Lachnospiraceae bacterium]|nr:ABC transporter permease [Lachnospiraceae bacterium]
WKNFISTALIIIIVSTVTGEEMFTELSATRTGVFALICACVWVGLFNSIRSVCRERDIVKREYRTGLHISSYVLAHAVYEMMICAGEALIIFLVVYIKNMSHFPSTGLVFTRSIDMYITFWIVIFSSDMLALMISCIVRSESTAMTVMPFVLIVQLVMAGTIFELSGLTEMISYFTISKWGFDAVCSIANTNTFLYAAYMAAGKSGAEPNMGNLMFAWTFMIAYAVIYIAIGIIALKQVDRDKR